MVGEPVKLKKYLLCMSVDYATRVEAPSAEDARQIGQDLATADWDSEVWSEVEVEEIQGEPSTLPPSS